MTQPTIPQSTTFRVGLTGDFFDNGKPAFPDFDLGPLEAAPGIDFSVFAEHRDEIGPDQMGGFHGVIVLSPSVTRQSLAQCGDQLLAISRFGVGYDNVDVDACTGADIALCITVGAVDRPVAEATVGWILGLAYRTGIKDRQLREARWDQRGKIMGCGLRGRTVGIVGLGGIGRTLVGLLRGFDMNPPLVFDPFLDADSVSQLGAQKVDLHDLMAQSDFITVHCPLNSQTKNLISAPELERMKPDAFIINTARGGIINEDALFEALSKGRIAGAALDCFADEPITKPHRFGELENVLLAPHNIAWTHELFHDIGAMASQSMIDLANGKRPHGVVNPEVFDRPSFQKKWASVRLG